MYKKGCRLKINGRNMAVSELGEGDRVLIFTPGLGCPSTAVEFRGVAEFLKEKYLMLFIDPLGYGFSEQTDEPRTTENVTEELHAAICKLGVTNYTLVAHSLSGLAALEYANRYADELDAVVGIDCSVPKQYEVREMIENSAKMYEKRGNMKNSGINKNLTKLICKKTLGSCRDYKFTKEEVELYTQLSMENCNSQVTLNEIALFGENALSLKEKKFPPQVPVLFLLSKKTAKQFPDWVDWHSELISGDKSKIVMLGGDHNLHLTSTKEVAENIDDFIV